jgi:sugar phosphate permease
MRAADNVRTPRSGSAVTTATAAASNFTGLAIASFLIGMFQATIANSCVAITQSWYRRQEQSYRTTYWQIANSMSSVVGPLLTYGVGHAASSGGLHQYQAICICLVSLLGFSRAGRETDSFISVTGLDRRGQYTSRRVYAPEPPTDSQISENRYGAQDRGRTITGKQYRHE